MLDPSTWHPANWDPSTWFGLTTLIVAVLALLFNPREIRESLKAQVQIRKISIPRWAVLLLAFVATYLGILICEWLGRVPFQIWSAIVHLRHFFSQTVLIPRWMVFSLCSFSGIGLIALAIHASRLLRPADSNHNT